MKAEIERVLGMVKDGTLTPEQASEMIAALTGGAPATAATPAAARVTSTPSGAMQPTVEAVNSADEPAQSTADPTNRVHAASDPHGDAGPRRIDDSRGAATRVETFSAAMPETK